jgi:putative nucleotidyltransferase with HDIG domain
MPNEGEIQKLISIIEEIAEGKYSNAIMELTKPDYSEDVRRIAEAMGMMMVRVEAREMLHEQLIGKLKELNEQLKDSTIRTVTTVANALAARDIYTQGHVRRVSAYAESLARCLSLPEDEVERIGIAAMLHDIGKIGFSDKLFIKEDTELTREMLDEVHKHPACGVEILRDLNFLGTAIDYVHSHHERLDGSGYPRGLRGEEIPLGARIISVADCFDAITTDRPYHSAKSCEEAFAILRRLSGNSLSPELVEAFIAVIESEGTIRGG